MGSWFPLVAALAAVVACSWGMVRSGALVPAEEVALRRMRGRLRARTARRPAARVQVRRPGVLGRLDELRDLHRLLVIAGRRESPAQWCARVLALLGLVVSVLLTMDAVSYANDREVVIPLSMITGLCIAAPLIAILQLRRAADQRRLAMGRALGDLMPVFATLDRMPGRDPQHIDASDPIAVMARCLADPSILAVFETNAWRQLAPDARPQRMSELFEIIAEAYGVPEAAQFASVLRNVSERASDRIAEEYIRESQSLTRTRTADARVRAGSRAVTLALPNVGLLIALLIALFSPVVVTGLGAN